MLLAARASRIENQDAIDAAIVGMLADPQEVPFPSLSQQIRESIWVICQTRTWCMQENLRSSCFLAGKGRDY